MNAAERWSRPRSDEETVLYRCVRDGFRLSVRDGRLKVGRYDGSAQKLPDGLRNSVAAHREGLKGLLGPWGNDELRDEFGSVIKAMAELYPVGVGCDLSPFEGLLLKAQEAAERDDWAGFRFALYLACRRGIALCEAHREIAPETATQEALTG